MEQNQRSVDKTAETQVQIVLTKKEKDTYNEIRYEMGFKK